MRDMSQKQHQKFPKNSNKKLSVINIKISHKILMSVFAQIFKIKIRKKPNRLSNFQCIILCFTQ